MLDQLATKIENKTAIIGTIGLGYVGLPLCAAFEKAGFKIEGELKDGTVSCPIHTTVYDIKTGAPSRGPAKSRYRPSRCKSMATGSSSP